MKYCLEIPGDDMQSKNTMLRDGYRSIGCLAPRGFLFSFCENRITKYEPQIRNNVLLARAIPMNLCKGGGALKG